MNEEEFRKKWNVKDAPVEPQAVKQKETASWLRRWVGGGNAAKAADTVGNKTGNALKELGQ